jgi:ygbB family
MRATHGVDAPHKGSMRRNPCALFAQQKQSNSLTNHAFFPHNLVQIGVQFHRHSKSTNMIRVGMGFDVHQLVEGRDLWLGGIKIPHSMGLQGHSDADVLTHAISDALLGAANLRDIGYHFPDTSDKTLNMDSKIILKGVVDLLAEKGYHIGNIDATLCAERPKINPHVPAMRACLAQVMDLDEDQISIKATTTEHLGFTGREEGMSAYAVCLIEK